MCICDGFFATFALVKRLMFILLFLLLVLASCHDAQYEARQMVRCAERLFDTDPDSTVALIDSVLRMPVYFNEKHRMEMALLQGEALFGDHGQEIPPLMDDEFFDDKPFLTISPELERATDYYARKKQYAKAAHAALYSGYVQQHYGEKQTAMQSFKDAERYGKLVLDSLTIAQAEYWMGKMLLSDNMEHEALALLKKAEGFFGRCLIEKAFVQNSIAVSHILLGDYGSSEIYLQQSLVNARKSHVDKVIRKALNNYAVLYQLQGKHAQAIACLKQNSNNSNLDEKESLLLNLNLGNVFFDEGEMDSANYYYNYVDSFLPKAQIKSENKVSAYRALSRFAESQQNDSLALHYWKQYIKWLNEVRDQSEQNNLYGIQRKYDYETSQNIMNQRVIRRQRIIIALSILVAVVLLMFFVSQIRLARIRKQEAEIKASLLHFMKQNEELAKQSEAVRKAHHDLEQRHQETEVARQTFANQAEEYKNAYEASDKKLSKALLKEQQIMQKMAVYLGNKTDSALLDALKYSVLGNQQYWDAMLKTFDKQFPGMRKEIALQHPDLSEIEQKILLLSYVDASREDTSVLLGISVFMVDKLRTSVKKKMATKTLNAINKA